MYHLLSVSSAMLISFLIGLLFAAMCAIVGRQKGYSTALCILLGFFGRLICLLILILLPDRMQEQYESDHLKQELSSLRQRMAELEQALEPTPAPEPAAPAITPVQVRVSRPRASFDVDLGPDHTEVKEGGSEPIEPLIVGPGGTFGQNPLRPAPRPAPQPIVQDAVETDASDFFAKAAQPVQPAVCSH